MRVEDAGGQTQERVHVGLFEQLAANRFSRAAFKEYVVRDDDSSAAVLFEDREHMLEKIELLVAG